MQEINEWTKAIGDELGTARKAILIAGASGSGKSYSAMELKKHLESQGLRVFNYSMDNYYIGLSKILAARATQINHISAHSAIVAYIIENTTKTFASPEKFSDKNIDKVQAELELLFGEKIGTEITESVVNEFKNINFDEPNTLDLPKFITDLNSLLNYEKIKLPNYDFNLWEPTTKTEIDGADYDCFIAEGLFALHPSVISNLDKTKIITAAIQSDLKSLLTRRLNRDIKSKRSSEPAERVLFSYLNQAVPSYLKYIYPSFKNAHFILNAGITDIEMGNRESSNQVKYLAPNDINQKLNALNAVKVSEVFERDYFMDDLIKFDKMLLRVREVNGKITKLTFKENSNKCTRAVDEYEFNSNISTQDFLRNFTRNGFEISQVVSKKRQIYNLLNGSLKLDNVDGIGTFVELDRENEQIFKQIKSKLQLTNHISQSYYELSQNLNSKVSKIL